MPAPFGGHSGAAPTGDLRLKGRRAALPPPPPYPCLPGLLTWLLRPRTTFGFTIPRMMPERAVPPQAVRPLRLYSKLKATTQRAPRATDATGVKRRVGTRGFAASMVQPWRCRCGAARVAAAASGGYSKSELVSNSACRRRMTS